ncbi:MAG: methyl-accepting chemotaxis protein, partial [Rhodocyclaceae bacterium]|nr:methyl-accepting chemotaxis protein [Rhodocyclaceae bacterium]
MLRSITLSQRLWLWAAFATAIFYIACALAWFGLAAGRDSLQKVHDESLVSLLEIVEFRQLLNANRLELLLALQHAPASGFAQIHDHPTEMHFEAIEKRAAEIEKIFANIQAKALDAEGKHLFAEFATKREAWLSKAKEIIAAMKGGDFSPALAAKILAASRVEFSAMIEALNQYARHHQKVAQHEFEAAQARYEATRNVLIALIVLGALLGTGIGVSTLNRLKQGLGEAQEVAQKVAAGDLSHPIEVSRADEIGRLLGELGKMQSSLRQLIGSINAETQHLARQSAELDRAAQNGKTIAGNQSEAASAMAAAVQELSVSIDQVEAHAEEVRRITQEAAQRSRDSAQVIAKATAEIHDIAQAVTNTAQDIRALEQVSARISGIVNVIREIADQTNLLA